MSKRVLDVGNCSPDHASICSLVSSQFGAAVDQAETLRSALALLEDRDYALALVNRILDSDGSQGIDVIRRLKSRYPELPVMLITNYEDHQTTAVEAGAVPGFGKRQLDDAATAELLARYLD